MTVLRDTTSITPLESPDFVSPPVALEPAPDDAFHPASHVPVPSSRNLWATLWPSLRFLFQTEVHVYSFAVAVNVLLSFFPFLVAMIILCRSVLHWKAAVQVILQVVSDYFPAGFGLDIPGYLVQAAAQGKFSWVSLFLLLFTANGIFVPLEVAFNRIWEVKHNRSFMRNQIVSLGLIFACGALVLASVSVTALNVQYVAGRLGTTGHFRALIQTAIFKLTALPISMLMIFLVYKVLPNARIAARRLIPASIVVGALLEVSKYINILTWPWLRAKLRTEVPPFVQSISIVLWAFIATMIVLAGAEWSARVTAGKATSPPPLSEP